MYCNKCFEEIPDGSTRCPYCGADLKTVSKGKKKSGGGLFGGAKKNKRSPGGQQVDETWNIMGNNSYANDNYDPGMQGGEMYGGGGMQGGDMYGGGGMQGDDIYGGGGMQGGEMPDPGKRGKGNKRGGGKKSGGGSKFDPKIIIILVVALLLTAAIVVGILIFLKNRGDGSTPPSRNTTVTSSKTEETTSVTSTTSAAPTTSAASTTSATPTTSAASTTSSSSVPTRQPDPDSKADVKSSFEEDTADSYFWPNSNVRLYTYEDLENRSVEQIEFIKAEIYAREGCIFKDKKYSDYFKKKSWYKGSIDEDKFKPDKYLNYYELENIDTINKYLEQKK